MTSRNVKRYVNMVSDIVDRTKCLHEETQRRMNAKIDEMFEEFKDEAVALADDMTIDDVIELIDCDEIDDESKYPVVATWADKHSAELMAACACSVKDNLLGVLIFGAMSGDHGDGEDE